MRAARRCIRRAPGKGQRLFDLAQAEYWIGFVAWQQGRLDDAETWLTKYRDSAIRLAAMDRNNFAWQQEVAWGYHNLAVLDDSRGRYREAERGMHEVLMLRRAWSQAHPADTEIRRAFADTMSWLGSLSAQQGKLAEAEDFFVGEIKALSRNAVDEPKHAQWQEEKADALLLLAKVQVQRGRLREAHASIAAALVLATGLARQDPANHVWRVTPGICHWWQAQLAVAAHEPDVANSMAADAATVFARTHAAEPKDDRARRWLAKARHLQAQLSLARGDVAAAQAHLAESEGLIGKADQASRDESLRVLQAERLVLSGEAMHRAGNRTIAQDIWSEAEQLLVQDAATALPFDRLEPLVRTLHYLGRQTQARVHEERLSAAGYKPLRPWPPPAAIAMH